MRFKKNRGATNAATPVEIIRTGKPNSNENTNSSHSPQLILVGYQIDKHSLVSLLFRQEVSHG